MGLKNAAPSAHCTVVEVWVPKYRVGLKKLMCFPSCLLEYLGGVNLFFLGPSRSPSRVGKETAVVGWDGNVLIEKTYVYMEPRYEKTPKSTLFFS